MKVTFICGSLEPGKDGVGDYVRRLGAALIRNGHSVAALALYDTYVNGIVEEIQIAEGTSLDVLRLPAGGSAADAERAAGIFVSAKNPDWVSLQFVPYAFHRKGLPFSLRGRLAPLLKGRRFQVMFHELWLDTPANFKQKVSAIIQRRLILGLIKKLRPQAVNVSILFGQERLSRFGVVAGILELFGNIYPEDKETSGEVSLTEKGVGQRSVLFFGEPPKGTFRDVFLSGIDAFCKTSKANVRLLLACGDSAAKQEFYERLSPVLEVYGYELRDCGFLSAPALSKLMLHCDAGVSKSKPHLLLKSGAAVAMLEHGLPIWIPRWNGRDDLPVNFRKELVFADLNDALSAPKLAYQTLLPVVASKFIEQLSMHRLQGGGLR
jgi:hypothetical protein